MANTNKIENLLGRIIPPDDYLHRNGFTNNQLIDELSHQDRSQVEEALIEKLQRNEDLLIVETLAYMGSTRALPVLNKLLGTNSDPMKEIIVSSSIFRISNDSKMATIASGAFKRLTNSFSKIAAFQYLKTFHNPDVNSLIGEYVNDKDFLLAHNAKVALGIT